MSYSSLDQEWFNKLLLVVIGILGMLLTQQCKIGAAETIFVDHNNNTHYLNGYEVHDEFMSNIENLFGGKITQALTYYLKHYIDKPILFFTAVDKTNYIFLQFFHSVFTNDLIISNFFLSLLNIPNSTYFKNWLNHKINLPSEDVYQVVKRLSQGPSAGLNPIQRPILDEIFEMDNKYNFFLNAFEKGDTDLIAWLLQSGFPLERVGLKALDLAWHGSRWNMVKMLIGNPSFPNNKIKTTKFHQLVNEKGETLMHLAADVDSSETAVNLHNSGADVNIEDKAGKTPIQRAIEAHKNRILRTFIDIGAELNFETESAQSLLHIAVSVGNYEATNLLLKEGFFINRMNEIGLTPFNITDRLGVTVILNEVFAICAEFSSRGDKQISKLLQIRYKYKIENACSRNKLNGYKDSDMFLRNLTVLSKLLTRRGAQSGITGDEKCFLLSVAVDNYMDESVAFILGTKTNISCISSAVFRAVVKNDVLSLTHLLKAGANITLSNADNLKPIHVAAARGNVEALLCLLNHGDHVNSEAFNGRTVLHIAARYGHTDVIKVLLERGANMRLIDHDGRQVINEAARNGQDKVVSILLENGADPNVKNYVEKTPLFDAAGGGHEETVKVLLNNGADVNERDQSSRTALHAAISSGNAKVVLMLLNRGAEVDAVDKSSKTPLIDACVYGFLPIVKILISRGANVNATGLDEYGPLHLSSILGRAEIVKALLDNGAYINVRDGQNKTPLFHAVENDQMKVSKVLLDNGADVNAKSSEGETPLTAARKWKFVSIAWLLEEHGGAA